MIGDRQVEEVRLSSLRACLELGSDEFVGEILPKGDVIDVGHDLFLGGPIASELVGDHHPGLAVLLDQPAQKRLAAFLLRCFCTMISRTSSC